MDLGFGSSTLFLLLTGGFAVAAWGAVVRRDGPSTIAMGTALVGTAHLAGLPGWLLTWGCTVIAVVIAMSLIAMVARWLSGSDAYRLGMIGTTSIVALLIAHHEHRLPSAGGTIGDRSLAMGTYLHERVETLAGG